MDSINQNAAENINWQYENGRVYSTDENGKTMCETTFNRQANGVMNINHTYVTPALRGQGVAEKMMATVAEHFREKGFKAAATCPYADVWLKRHKEMYSDIFSE